ncbi:MAG: MoxR family ATPase [Thermoproteota archaeon]|nr:MAG: MoxR family ATPase [Candidatus Korarchaeota archaeon]
MDVSKAVLEIQSRLGIVGRARELQKALVALMSGRHVLLEGPVGVGKTTIAVAMARWLGREVVRVDGDERYYESKLVGHWDPPIVMKKGYCREAFVEGPLVRAMMHGAVLLINELNRLPESAQNVLLPALDEGIVYIPNLGEVKARPEFRVIATQNTEEHVGVSKLSEAVKDRFVLVRLDYPPEEEECEIVKLRSGVSSEDITLTSVKIVRALRGNPIVRRGPSIRASIDLAVLVSSLNSGGKPTRETWIEAAEMCVPTRMDVDPSVDISTLIRRAVEAVLGNFT